MNDLAPDRETSLLHDQRRRFARALGLGRSIADATDPCPSPAEIVMRLEVEPADRLLADLPRLADLLLPNGILVVVEQLEEGKASPLLRAALGLRFRCVATLQQRPLTGSIIAGERHAGSRILPLSEPVQAPPACLMHLASDSDLPAFAPMFLESAGVSPAAMPLQPMSVAQSLPPALAAPGCDLAARRRAVGLVERLVDMDARSFAQAREIERLRRLWDETPRAVASAAFDIPRTRHPWPLAQQRFGPRGAYDRRVDDAALLEGDAGAAFLERHSLLGHSPDITSAVAALNAAPRTLLSARPDVSIVIPVYGQLGYTLNCLDSLFALTGKMRAEIIIVDDASPDRSAAVLGRVRGVAVMRQRINRGFIASCNAGASQARGRYVLFLNNDTRVVAGWLDTLVDSFTLFPKAGLVGSKMLYADGTLQEAGGIIWRDGSCWNDGRDDDPNRPHYAYARQVDYISGCSIMLPTSLFRTLGGFDPYYAPAYCEDADLAMRVREAGHEVWFQPQSRVVHYEGRTSGTDTASGAKASQVVNSRKLFLRWRERLARHRPNGEAPFLERERHVSRRALIVDATAPTPRQDAGSVTTTLTLQLFQQLGYKAHFVPQDNFLFQPGHCTDLMQAGIEVAYAPYESGFDTYLRRFGATFDVVLVFRVTVLEQVIEPLRRFAPQAPILFHTMDLHFLRMERQARQQHDSALLAEASAMKQREVALIGQVDGTITHSTYERQLLAQAVPAANLIVWPFMFAHHGTSIPFSARRDICFLGGYRHAPNVDAAMFFAREVLPLIRRVEPQARFIIAGANPTAQILTLAGPDILVTGEIDDLRDVFDQARVFACSLRIGAGTKGKVSTAMSYGLPVVSTSCGAEGMDLLGGENVLLADSAADLAAACLRLYRDPVLWQHLSQSGQDLVRTHHSLEMGRRVLADAIETSLRHRLGLSEVGSPVPSLRSAGAACP